MLACCLDAHQRPTATPASALGDIQATRPRAALPTSPRAASKPSPMTLTSPTYAAIVATCSPFASRRPWTYMATAGPLSPVLVARIPPRIPLGASQACRDDQSPCAYRPYQA